MERVKAAAIKRGDTLRIGKQHSEIIPLMIEAGCEKPIRQHEQGFINQHWKFIDRITAGEIAWKAGQIKLNPNGGPLFSEEIWSYGLCEWDSKKQEYF